MDEKAAMEHVAESVASGHCPTCTCPIHFAENGQLADFIDHDELPRYSSRFGFNAFGTARDAYRSHAAQRGRGATTYVWRLADGLYTASVTPDLLNSPWQVGAELVEVPDARIRREPPADSEGEALDVD